MGKGNGPGTPEQFRADLERLGTIAAVARSYGMPRKTLDNRASKWGLKSQRAISREEQPEREAAARTSAVGVDQPGAAITDTTATVTLPIHPKREGLRTKQQVLEDHGLNPEEWEVASYADNYWAGNSGDGPSNLTQSKVIARAKVDLSTINLRIETTWRPPTPKIRRPNKITPMMVPLFSDPHFPLHEEDLYEASLVFCDTHEEKIKEIIIPGDEGDWTPFGRHGTNRRINVSVSDAILGVYTGLSGWRKAAPNAPIKLIPGNHTHWLQKRLMELFPNAADIVAPGDDYDYLSLRGVCKLDELHIDYLDTKGEYHDIHYEVANGLIVMHGTRTGKHGGATKEIEVWEGTSVMQGHDHSGALTVINYRLPNGGYVQRYAVSMMAMARRDMGYSPKRDVAQGFPVVSIWPDGQWHIDLAFFNPQTRTTTWRDWRYKPA